MIGPSLRGVYGHEVELSTGEKVVVDDNYIRESLLEPTAKVVAGYQPVMPSFKGQVSEDDIRALINYIKGLAGGAAAATGAEAEGVVR